MKHRSIPNLVEVSLLCEGQQQHSLVRESAGCSVTTARGENKGILQNSLIQELLRKAEPQAH